MPQCTMHCLGAMFHSCFHVEGYFRVVMRRALFQESTCSIRKCLRQGCRVRLLTINIADERTGHDDRDCLETDFEDEAQILPRDRRTVYHLST